MYERDASNNAGTLLILSECHYFEDEEGAVWVDTQCDSAFWDRYLQVFSHLIIIGRFIEKVDSDYQSKMLRSDRRGVSFCKLPDFRGPKGMLRYFRRYSKSVANALRQADCSIFRAPSPIAFMCYTSIVKSGKPFAIELVVNPQTAFSKESIHSLFQPIIQLYSVWLTKRMCMKANGVAYVTREILQRGYPCRAILQGESKSYFTASYSTITLIDADYREPFTFSADPLVLVNSGSMNDYRKKQDIVLNTARELIDRGIACKVVLIGGGSLLPEYRKMAKELGLDQSVLFTGNLPGPKYVRQVLRKCSVFLFPSTSEGLPRAVIEAMATGLLCVGSGADGMLELLESSCVCNTNTPKEYADIIESFVNQPDEALEIMRKQFERSKSFHSILLNERRKDFYSKLMSIC